MPSSLAALEAARAAPALPNVALRTAGSSSLSLQLSFAAGAAERPRLKLAARSKPIANNEWEKRDMGAGGEQWSGLNVSADRKKKRCADCSRPLADGHASLLCDRCAAPADDVTWRWTAWRRLTGLAFA